MKRYLCLPGFLLIPFTFLSARIPTSKKQIYKKIIYLTIATTIAVSSSCVSFNNQKLSPPESKRVSFYKPGYKVVIGPYIDPLQNKIRISNKLHHITKYSDLETLKVKASDPIKYEGFLIHGRGKQKLIVKSINILKKFPIVYDALKETTDLLEYDPSRQSSTERKRKIILGNGVNNGPKYCASVIAHETNHRVNSALQNREITYEQAKKNKIILAFLKQANSSFRKSYRLRYYTGHEEIEAHTLQLKILEKTKSKFSKYLKEKIKHIQTHPHYKKLNYEKMKY